MRKFLRGSDLRIRIFQAKSLTDMIFPNLWEEDIRRQTAAAALAQIKAKDYAAPYRARNLPIWAIGLNFDSKTRGLIGADYERLA